MIFLKTSGVEKKIEKRKKEIANLISAKKLEDSGRYLLLQSSLSQVIKITYSMIKLLWNRIYLDHLFAALVYFCIIWID